MHYESAKTHCPQGHPYNEQNTRVCNGSRYCRQCDNDAQKRKRRKDGRIVVARADRTHCPTGHEYTDNNTRVSAGSRFCRACDKGKQIAKAIAHPEKPMWEKARERAKRSGVPFEIQPKDIVIPSHCPVLGILLQRNTGVKGSRDASPSLDRIEPAKGYVVGNIVVISMRANRIKNDASLKELEQVTSWLRGKLQQKGM